MASVETPAPHVDTVTLVPPRDLNVYYRNARKGDVDAIAASLKARSQYKPLTVNIGTATGRPREVLAGNHTLMAIRQLAEKYPDDPRWETVKCFWLDVDEETAKAIVVGDNKIGQLGGYDEKILAELLTELGDQAVSTGYTDDEINDLVAALAEGDGGSILDDSKPTPEMVISYAIVFDDEGQQNRWFEFVRWLKQRYPDQSTIAERIDEYLLNDWSRED